ncbi:MAG: Acidobacterial duplicated orphan permease (function unknown) [uncultured Adhaeribacter sp.]|uniref:ABC transporter, permease protein n=1 Tax=uncultured Adhaeribacter sp. TaxID=448109 RepID=A0A6J4HXS1_9BACT|nr:MAG: Acidobacterial duplicated orphan permease (function unknown) [uncultured Adhaeribacter sp.]
MLRNFITTAFRSLKRNKANSVINIAGLALGIACCLMIFLVVRHERSYDTFHSKADRIYRINTQFLKTGGFSGGAPMPVANALKQNFPEVEQATTAFSAGEGLLKINNQLYQEPGIAYVAPEYFSIIDANWLAGNPQSALAEPNSVVLTKTLAQKYFGGTGNQIAQRALGKIIKVDAQYTLKVTGILEDLPDNTDLPFKILVSWSSLKVHAPDWDLNDWVSFGGSNLHLVLLRPGTDVAELQKKIPAMEKKYMGALEASRRTHLLQPLREMHYDERFGNLTGRVVAKENLGGLVLIGVFILLIACINFINLATAQSVKRSKEVGVRKVLGANRGQLIRQFLAETSLLSLLATILAAALTFFLLPQFKELLNLELSFNLFADRSLMAFLLLTMVAVSLLAGLYPALVISGFQPVLALKNKITASRGKAFSLRRSLIAGQFIIAQVLIISTIVVSNQLEYSRSKSLGFDKEAVVTLPIPAENKPETARALRQQLEQLPGIKNLSFANAAPSSESSNWSTFTFTGSDPTKEYYIQEISIDHTYLQTYGLTLLAGKNLDLQTDSAAILVNEKVLRTMNIPSPEAAINQKVNWRGKQRQIVGVVQDFHTRSLKEEISGVFMCKEPYTGLIGLKLEPASLRVTMTQVEQLWKKTYPESLFEFTFLDETVAGFYKEEVKMFKLFRLFAGIAVFISCLGLYGLVSFMAVQRTKEIGIRKVLGASVTNIVGLFTKEFFVLILVAFAVAAPLAWYAMQAWLQSFEYRNPIGPGSFVMAILFSLLIAGITVIYRSVRAALTSPVQNLRSE